MVSLLRIANIEKSYSISKNQKQEVLKGVDAEFDRGELVALVGESGSGKSTLINILGGLDHDYTGSVVVKGNFIRDFNERELDDYRKKRVGMIFQNYNLINHMTLLENVEIAMRMSSIDKEISKQRALDLLDMVGLKEFSDKIPNQLSGGQQQRVAIARALANNPSIILADEPTGALDKESEELILKILKKIVESGKLVIIVTHSHVVANFCSRIVTLDEGILISDEKRYNIVMSKGAYEKVIMPKPIQKRDLFKLSINNLKQKWSRSILVSVGMSIGIAAMIIILALSRGLTLYVEDVFGDNIVSKQMVVTKDSYLSFIDAEIDVIEDFDGIEEVIISSYFENSDYIYKDVSASIDGLSGYYTTFYPAILYGSLQMTPHNVMINETFALELSGDLGIISVVGTEIEIEYNNFFYTFTISAIYEDLTETSDESNVLIQNEDFDTIFSAGLFANQLLITVNDVTYLNAIIEDLENIGYYVYQDDSSATTVMDYLSLGTKVLAGVSGISMVVAAIMIFIVLYISIVERTKEIGILRAIGAQKKDIKHMFMYEAGILGLFGGVIGVFFAIFVTLLTNTITEVSMDASLMSINYFYVFSGIIISITISVFAGIAPSIKASQLDPIESLRFE